MLGSEGSDRGRVEGAPSAVHASSDKNSRLGNFKNILRVWGDVPSFFFLWRLV